MKRAPGLRDLSSEHHTGLVLVRHIRHAVDRSHAETRQLWDEVVERFRSELEPHFRKEELGLLPALEKCGERALVVHTLREHRIMHDMVVRGGPQNLERFAQLLADHIRFEEKVLFEVAQERLPPDALDGSARTGRG